MKLTINGETKEFEMGATLAQIIEDLGIKVKVMAIAVNMEVVKKDAWATHIPSDGDKIEMLHFVGGG